MVVNSRPIKRMKRRVTADLHDFLTFPSSTTAVDGGPFRSIIREFLATHALLPPPSSLFPHLLTWQILFRVGDFTDGESSAICVDVVEEDVARSRSVYCDQCRVVGWSEHPVCGKRYHFIIRADGNSISGYHKSCPTCGDYLQLSESRCKTCNHAMTTEDVEDWVFHQLEDTTHILHGVVHSNGYGHLLRVNGREGGSRVLSGHLIMDFWDRLCKFLAVRKVSVMDVSKKYGLEYRLLHAIIKGHPWYGDWGFEFGAGSFGLTLDAYKAAVDTLASLPLSIYLSPGRKPRTHLQDTISFYQSLSERELVNIRDLFCFLTGFLHDTRKSSSGVVDDLLCKKQRQSCVSGVLCVWTSSDIQCVEEAMFRVLRAVSGSNWVSWRALRGAVCRAGPPELLDYCLKELSGKPTGGGMVVRVRCNPDSGALEYRLEAGLLPLKGMITSTTGSINSNFPSEEHVLRDLKYLYETILHPRTMLPIHGHQSRRDLAIASATKLLDSKQFVKNYNPDTKSPTKNPFLMRISCQVGLLDEPEDDSTDPPPELIVLAPDSTLLDLKLEAARAFRDVYLMFKRFEVEEVVDFSGVDDSTHVKLLFGLGLGFESVALVRVRGRCPWRNSLSKYRMERGLERWIVDCGCGAKDDDGERMLACDGCGVWLHTRCVGIDDLEAVPASYVCRRCRGGGGGGGRVVRF